MSLKLLEELQRETAAGDEADLGRVLEISEELLSKEAGDQDAVKCRVTALILQDEFKAAGEFIDSLPNKRKFNFERLYCMYQLKQNDKALSFARSVDPRRKNRGFWHVEAQLLYRLGRFAEAAEVYRKQLSPERPATGRAAEHQADTRTNYLASLSRSDTTAALSFFEKLDSKEWSYALAFNAAQPLADTGRFDRAIEALKAAADRCAAELGDDDEDGDTDGGPSDEVKAELETVALMRAFVQQKSGSAAAAEKGYRALLDSKQVNVATPAGINLIQLKNGSGEECKALARRAVEASASAKLTPAQQRALLVNYCVVMLQGAKPRERSGILSSLRKRFPDSDIPVIAFASVLSRDGSRDGKDRAAEALRNYVKECTDSKVPCAESRVVLAQTLLSQRRVDEAVDALQGLGDSVAKQPAVVGVIVRQYRRSGQLEKAAACLDGAIAYWSASNDVRANDYISTFRAAGADLKLKLGEFEAAAEAYEAMASATGDMGPLCGLVAATSQFDQARAAKYAKKLPPVEAEDEDVDALMDQLENLAAAGAATMDVDVDAGGEDAKASASAGADQKKKPKKKRKRKKRLPKNYDPEETPDPERWLPKWERSYNKRRRRRRGDQLRGPQGGPASAKLAAKLDKSGVEEKPEKKSLPQKKMTTAEKRRAKRRNKKKRK